MMMPSTTAYNFSDVVLVGFPFTNLQTTKKRPAVIISSQIYQQNRPDVILMAITSQIRQPLAIGEAILQDWRVAGLAKPSVLKPLIATIEKSRIVKTMGQLSAADRESLGKVIQAILGNS
jgi:mRNA interferase MazF